MLSRTRLLQAWACLSVVAAVQIVFASITTGNFSLAWQHQEAALAGCNTVTTILAVLYTIMSGGILTGWFSTYVRNLDMWYLSLCTSSMWMGAVYIQSAMVSHAYVGQALIAEALREWSAGATAALRASFMLGDVLGVAYIVFGAVLLYASLAGASGLATYEPLSGTA